METNWLRAYVEMWVRMLDYKGRSRRVSYWSALGIDFVIATILAYFSFRLSLWYSIFSILPGIAMSVRRLHDTGRRGWWLCLVFIPFGGILVLVLLMMDSTGANSYGRSPKYGDVPF